MRYYRVIIYRDPYFLGQNRKWNVGRKRHLWIRLAPFNHSYVFMSECKHGVNVFAGFAGGSIRADAQRDGEQTAGTATVRN